MAFSRDSRAFPAGDRPVSAARIARILAVLGPTNTGKTHLAVERMLGHATGMIGLPLRLLAREIYDRVRERAGAAQVALITGEERILPPRPRWYVCTVEAMPLDRTVDFLAVDEIQLCADPERGHVFTERLLRARGQAETMFLGADTVRGLIRRLVPGVEIESRPRFSTLRYIGPKKLSRLPRRSAIVAFSAEDVYAIAELIRRQRGGAAVVMGALSPRTRNAQVALYQEGEVDFLVATDAIGMGLNMDVQHVAFAATRKFDGFASRALTPAEAAQIAGRAGRHMRDGTFGTTAEQAGLEPELVSAIEAHRFDPVTRARWRNDRLRFDSVSGLLHSLELPPPDEVLVRSREADDHLALSALAQEAEILALARTPDRVRLLWQVCQIPDFRKTLARSHAELLARIFRHLAVSPYVLPADWMAAQVAPLERKEGDIETLASRLAHIRTWTYVSHRARWLQDAVHWQERTRAIEDSLSDTLHARLTQRFVDRRTALLVKRLNDRDRLAAVVDAAGEVTVEGEPIGSLVGLRFLPDRTAGGLAGRTLRAAASRGLQGEITRRATRLIEAEVGAIELGPDGRLAWEGGQVAELVPGETALRPRIRLFADEEIERALRERVLSRLEAWLADRLETVLPALFRLDRADLDGAARGLAFQLCEGLGILARDEALLEPGSLAPAEVQRLARLGVRFGALDLYLPARLKPAPARLCTLLWSIHVGEPPRPPPPAGRVSLAADPALPPTYWQVAGYRLFAGQAVRIDMVERLAEAAEARAAEGPFAADKALQVLVRCPQASFEAILLALGYRAVTTEAGRLFQRPKRHRRTPKPRPQSADEASPFAKLRRIVPR